MATALSGFVFLLGRKARFLFAALFVWMGLCAEIDWFLKLGFLDRGVCGEAMAVTLMNTSESEIREFARLYATPHILAALGAIFGFTLMAVVGLFRLPRCAATQRSFYVFAAIEAVCCFLLPKGGCIERLLPAIADHAFLRQSAAFQMYHELSEASKNVPKEGWTRTTKNRLVVVAIGESASRAHWSLYGYKRRTTPEMEALSAELTVLSNVVSVASLTPFALRDALTRRAATGEMLSIPALAASVGYDCALISAHGRLGVFDGADELLFRSCRSRLYLDEHAKAPFYDEALLPFVAKELASGRQLEALFVHLYGSHIDWRERAPREFVAFSPKTNDSIVATLGDFKREWVNGYDNSIAYTDKVLSRLVSLLKDTKRPACLVYFSDHGEAPFSASRDPNSSETFAIPFVVWATQDFRAEEAALFRRLESCANKPICETELFPIFLNLLGIRPNDT